jgi:hypothetical protein
MNATTDTTKLNFMTDHGSTRDIVSCAWRREPFRLALALMVAARPRQDEPADAPAAVLRLGAEGAAVGAADGAAEAPDGAAGAVAGPDGLLPM